MSMALLAVYGTTGHRAEAAMFVAAGLAFAGLLATRVLPPGRLESQCRRGYGRCARIPLGRRR